MPIELYEHTGLRTCGPDGQPLPPLEGIVLGRRPSITVLPPAGMQLADVKPANGDPVITAFIKD